MGIMNVIGLMAEAKETAIYRGHNVKNWDVLGWGLLFLRVQRL